MPTLKIMSGENVEAMCKQACKALKLVARGIGVLRDEAQSRRETRNNARMADGPEDDQLRQDRLLREDGQYAALNAVVARIAGDVGSCRDAQKRQEEAIKREKALEATVRDQQTAIGNLQAQLEQLSAAVQQIGTAVGQQNAVIKELQSRQPQTKKINQKETCLEKDNAELSKFIETYKQTISGVCTELNECKLAVRQLQDVPRLRPKRRTLTVRDGVSVVRPEQFDNFDTKRVVFHPGVAKIADNAFSDWKYLKHIVFEGARLQSIGANAFRGTDVRVFVAPSSLQRLGEGAFYGCKNLKQVELNEGLSVIGAAGQKGCAGYGAFQDSGLETIKLPRTLQKIGCRTFEGCSSLKSVRFPPNLVAIGDLAFYGSGIVAFEAPTRLTSIGNSAFRNCNELADVKLNARLQTIGDSCFSSTAIREITIPQSVSAVGKYAFTCCWNLRTAYVQSGC